MIAGCSSDTDSDIVDPVVDQEEQPLITPSNLTLSLDCGGIWFKQSLRGWIWNCEFCVKTQKMLFRMGLLSIIKQNKKVQQEPTNMCLMILKVLKTMK